MPVSVKDCFLTVHEANHDCVGRLVQYFMTTHVGQWIGTGLHVDGECRGSTARSSYFQESTTPFCSFAKRTSDSTKVTS